MVRAIVGLGLMGAIVAVLSCGDGQHAGGDCPLGTFRPVGIQDCVIPADFNSAMMDNRCAQGSANSPTCQSSTGGRAYYATSTHCAPGYQYTMGSCVSGTGGVIGTGVGFPDGGFADGVGFFDGATAGAGGFAPCNNIAVDGSGFVDGSGVCHGTFTGVGGDADGNGSPDGIGFFDGSSFGGASGVDGAPLPTDAMSDARDASMSEPMDASDVGAGARDD